MKIAVIHGPNLNFTGIRQVEIYGNLSFKDMCDYIDEKAAKLGVSLAQFQSNHEGEIIDFIQKCHFEGFFGVVLNAGAFSHYSHAIADCIKAVSPPVVEVHMSNVYAREAHRHVSAIAAACIGQISGFGVDSYLLAIQYLKNKGENTNDFSGRF